MDRCTETATTIVVVVVVVVDTTPHDGGRGGDQDESFETKIGTQGESVTVDGSNIHTGIPSMYVLQQPPLPTFYTHITSFIWSERPPFGTTNHIYNVLT